MKPNDHFLNLYSHDFARVAVGVPPCRVADPTYNAAQTIALMQEAAARGVVLVAFPELGLSAYSCDDLFHQGALLDAVEAALGAVLEASADLSPVVVVGAPLRVEQRLFNCAVVIHRGQVLGVVPKTYLPNYGEFYEARQFNAADEALGCELRLLGRTVPFGAELVFEAEDLPLLRFHTEICEDVWVPIPPSSYAALAGATVLLNLSASNVTIGKANYRRSLVRQQSARCLAAYVYTSAGPGESTTDMAWDGQALIAENGELLAESDRYAAGAQLLCADLDLGRLAHERMRQTSFGTSVRRHADVLATWRTVRFTAGVDRRATLPLNRPVERFPYVPADPARRDERCHEVYQIQTTALVQRLQSSGIRKLVIGVSGGLDSTHALLVCAKAMDRMGLPRTHILAYSMPGYATGERTRNQALRLMEAVGCTFREIDIRPSCDQMFRDLGHPFADGHPVYDIAFENVQAGERTNHLFRLANAQGALVVGTGDLSELALGWCTYGVGDHMSHYNVNASVPKTLIRHLVRWVAETDQIGLCAGVGEHGGHGGSAQVLFDILDTEISPELVPASASTGQIQSTEATIGLYELQDFNLYHVLRYGYTPTKIAFLAWAAWGDAERGDWPDDHSVERHAHALGTIKATLRIFLARFFRGSQFKRSCVPNAPKVGSGGSLSPRGDWRAPSDGESALWLDDLERVPDSVETGST